MGRIVEENKGLVYHVANLFDRMEDEDAIQEGFLAMLKREKDYDPNRGAISTFFYPIIVKAILYYIKKEQMAGLSPIRFGPRKRINIDSQDYGRIVFPGSRNKDYMPHWERIEDVMRQASLSEYYKQIVRRRLQGISFKNIAKEYEVSNQRIQQIWKISLSRISEVSNLEEKL